MEEADILYRAVLARDARFDGKFFVGVKTTGIYCRPICPAKPKRKNMEFFSSALLAEKAGYRPCLRCRPESAPMSPAWIGKSAIVHRALRLIANDDLAHSTEEIFASQLGVSARHLRRLFEEELGRTPKQIAGQNRLNFARKLLLETTLPVTEIAFASGFSSLRRFNDAVQKRFHRSPRELRKSNDEPSATNGLQLSISYRPPFDWLSLIHFYKSHQIKGVETINDLSYERIFKFEESLGYMRVQPNPEKPELTLEVELENPRLLHKVVRSVRHMFDLESDPILIAKAFSSSKLLKDLNKKYPGLRLPRGWDPFETAITAILGQLVSTEQASRLVEQLVTHYGELVKTSSGRTGFLFPSPKVLATKNLEKIRTTEGRRNAIRLFSRKVLSKEIHLDSAQDPKAFKDSLVQIKGIGHWTAEYVSLRSLGDTDAFPGTDLILRRVLTMHPKFPMDSIKPWRAYAAMALWKEYAEPLSKKRRKKP